MAIAGYPMQQQRPGYTGRAFGFAVANGHVIARALPPKRPRLKDPAALARMAWITQTAAEYHLQAGSLKAEEAAYAKLHAMRPRDWYTKQQAGRQWWGSDAAGHTIYPAVYAYCVSSALDATVNAPNAMAVRYTDAWRPLWGGTPGAILTMRGGFPTLTDSTPLDQTGPNTRNAAAVSLALDSITQTPGALLVRGIDQWTYIPPGTEGQVLTVQQDGTLAWQANR